MINSDECVDFAGICNGKNWRLSNRGLWSYENQLSEGCWENPEILKGKYENAKIFDIVITDFRKFEIN